MKYVGSYFEYEQERNRDLLRVFELLMDRRQDLPMADIYARVVEMPSERFWVSESRATIVVSKIIGGDDLDSMLPNKRAMFMEIYRRVIAQRMKRPGDSLYAITFDVVNSPAPRFYLTPGSAKVIISKIKRQWYEARNLFRA